MVLCASLIHGVPVAYFEWNGHVHRHMYRHGCTHVYRPALSMCYGGKTPPRRFLRASARLSPCARHAVGDADTKPFESTCGRSRAPWRSPSALACECIASADPSPVGACGSLRCARVARRGLRDQACAPPSSRHNSTCSCTQGLSSSTNMLDLQRNDDDAYASFDFLPFVGARRAESLCARGRSAIGTAANCALRPVASLGCCLQSVVHELVAYRFLHSRLDRWI